MVPPIRQMLMDRVQWLWCSLSDFSASSCARIAVLIVCDRCQG